MEFNKRCGRRPLLLGYATAAVLAGTLSFLPVPAHAVDNGAENVIPKDEVPEFYNGWAREGDELYWYDWGKMAKTKEAYDPETDAWYWFDSDGTMAFAKDVWLPKKDKWVRYDENGHMVKGLDESTSGTYYFDPITGEMYKGEVYLTLSKARTGWFHFDEITGKMDISKDTYLRSSGGKWVRYDNRGIMVKGESYLKSPVDGKMHWWYFDPTTGAMAKGLTTIPDGSKKKTVLYDSTYGWMLYGNQMVNGTKMYFDETTGALKREPIDVGDANAQKIIDIATSILGTPYKHAGRDPWNGGLSCDGLTWWVYEQAGIKVYDSWADTSFNGQSKFLKDRDLMHYTIDELQPGDIVFFGPSWSNLRHAGIYIGKRDGQHKMIHAAGHYVNGVRVGVVEGPLDRDFLGGGSPLHQD